MRCGQNDDIDVVRGVRLTFLLSFDMLETSRERDAIGAGYWLLCETGLAAEMGL
jgi:hypothetical protein